MSHMKEIFFLYGLAFFVMGIAVWLEASRSPTFPPVRALAFLATFGVIHGGHEWVEMFQLMTTNPPTLFSHIFRLVALAVSFVLLIEFGVRLLVMDNDRRIWQIVRWIILIIFLGGMILVWAVWGARKDVWAAADAWCRYSLSVPGAVLAAMGLFRQSKRLTRQQRNVSRDIAVIGIAFLLYGVPGQIFVNLSPLPPSTVLNSVRFMETFHFPIQLLRAVMASLAAVFTVRTLRLFETERQRQVNKLDQARIEAQQRLAEEMAEQEKLRRELLHQTVLAQEEERRHIARELHDEASQAMTAISWKLAALEQVLPNSHGKGHAEISNRIDDLRQLIKQVMGDLRQLTSRLRPAVLDELGLVPALIAHADDCSDNFSFLVNVEVTGKRQRLSSEIETTLYRIAQEALTNVAKHAQATNVSIQLYFDKQEVALSISDNGVGMEVENAQRAAAQGKGWGLAGINERVQLVEGNLDIHSAPGKGAVLSVWVPIPPIPPTKERNIYEINPVAVSR
ncbi:MAG: sensor histidine kinase [Chloroflexi bacterium]|nr:sensor histidine kinase [Chloroflexota bacterium]